jgi:tripartite-type tricarboxylate transporter receptor subunit TctC
MVERWKVSVITENRIGAVLLAAGIVLGGLLAATAGHAQYPSRPIKILVTVAPGSAPDTIARVLGERLSPLLGQPVVVENRAGSNGNIAMELVAKSAPDGYTMVVAGDSMIVINPHMYAKMPLDTLKDIVPVASVASNTFFLSVHPSVPVRNFQEFIEHARKANPLLAYASAGNGSQHQMAMEMLKQRAGIDLVHVPYKGGGPAATATVAGEVSAMFSGASTGPLIHAGRLRGLAATGRSRSPLFPELPTIGEFYPGYELSVWMGIFAPAGVPDAVLARLRAEINRVLPMPEVKERLNAAGGLEPYVTTPQEFADSIRSDYERYGKLVKQIGAKVD